MKDFKRRDFLKYAGAGVATILVGCNSNSNGDDEDGDSTGSNSGPAGGDDLPSGGETETLHFTITDAMKEMITHEPNNPGAGPAECYFWVFQEERFPADSPGPQIFAVEGDRIEVKVTNALDGPHAFFIPGPSQAAPPMVDTGPIAPGETVSVIFEAGAAGTYLYHDNMNAPVNRVMGLHGAFVVMPRKAVAGHKLTPYANPSPGVQQLFDDFGSTPWWPGLAWEEGDPSTDTPPARQHVWLCHQASPVLFAEVGEFAQANPGVDFPADRFVALFLGDPFINTSNDARTDVNASFPVKTTGFNRKPHFFTINGQSGFFAHHNPAIVPMYRVGEPCVVRILNAGLWLHSMHLHANHFYVTCVNNVPQENPLWLDVFNVFPMDSVDYTIPFMRPPDIPNQRGIGRADAGLVIQSGGTRTWPPVREFEIHQPAIGTLATSFDGTRQSDLAARQSPLCYPMHDHSEPSQTSQGGNYNCGLIAGVYFLGDRNTMMDFPMEDEFQMMIDFGRRVAETGPPPGGWPPEPDL